MINFFRAVFFASPVSTAATRRAARSARRRSNLRSQLFHIANQQVAR